MFDFGTVILAVFQVFAIIALGFAVRRVGWVRPEADADLTRLILNLLFPCFILHRTMADPNLQEFGTVATAASLGFGFVALGIAVCYFVAPLLRLEKGTGRRTFSVSCGVQNYGFVAIPVLESVTGKESFTGVLIMHNVGVDLAIWTLGIMVLTGVFVAPWKMLLNGPLLAIVAGLTLNYTGAGPFVLDYLGVAIGTLGACSIPLSLLLIGTTLSDLIKRGFFAGSLPIGIGSCFLRLGLLAAPFLLAARFLPVSSELQVVLVIEAAMPAAVFPIIMARHYGGHPETAVRVVTYTALASLITMPLVIGFGFWLIGFP